MGSDVAERNRRIVERFIEAILEVGLMSLINSATPASPTTRRRRKLATESTDSSV